MNVFEKLEGTSVALWVGESLWGYPIMLSLHVVGLAVVVGIFVMRDLRMLGWIRGIEYRSLNALGKLAWTGFLINAVSGAVLFSSQASIFIQSTPFLLKIASIFLAAICAAVIQSRLRLMAQALDDGAFPPMTSTRALAAASLCLWIGAIVAGRLIAYV